MSKKVYVRDSTGLTKELSAKTILMANLVGMGVGIAPTTAYYASLLYPGVNLPATVLVGILPALAVGFVYFFLSAAMPRTGGEYVWVSRILSPSFGFLVNFLITSVLWESIATFAATSISHGLVPMLGALGLLYSNESLIGLVSAIKYAPVKLVIILMITSLCSLPAFFGTRNTFKTVWMIFGITAVGTIVTVGAFLVAGPTNFIANFNQLSGMNYVKVISTAGLPTGYSIQATVYGSVFTMLAFIGYNFSSYYNGEIKGISRSQFVGMIGGIFVFAAAFGLLLSAVYYSIGSDFINAISNLAGTGNSYYQLPSAPLVNFLVLFATPNPVVIILSSFAVLAANMSAIVLFYFIIVRNFFAWSFDRILPDWFVKLSSRTNSPWLSLIVILALADFSALLYVYTIFFELLVYQVVLFGIAYAITCLAAVLFPYRKRSLFNAAPQFVRTTVRGIPLISILGLIGVVVSVLITVFAVLPVVTPLPSGSTIVEAGAYLFVPASVVAAFVIFWASYFYNKRKGTDILLAFRQLPPE
ncbi:MAG: amino acid permease [Candidatus Bathyarchaeia archaeon]